MKIRMTPGAILLVLVLLFNKSSSFPATVLAATLHECGHLLAAKLLKIKLIRLELDLMGAKLYPAAQLPSYMAEGLLAAAGPAASLLLALVPPRSAFWATVHAATLSFALFNLLPIEGFDGGRMLHALLAAKKGEALAHRVLFVTSYLSLLHLFSLSACLLLRYGENATLAVLAASLFARLFLTLHPTPHASPRRIEKK
ncbi:MAG: hypothetical protein E7585_02930 [Ruminococcaceae bacterium]|nr:hypothetical protein [Oscillospiraceae bacterium]